MYIGHKLEEKAIDMKDWNQMNVADRATELLSITTEPRRKQILENFMSVLWPLAPKNTSAMRFTEEI
jgi:hypothetical protein